MPEISTTTSNPLSGPTALSLAPPSSWWRSLASLDSTDCPWTIEHSTTIPQVGAPSPMFDSSSDAAETLPTAPLRTSNAIRLPRSTEVELIATLPSLTRLATDSANSGPHSVCQWLPTRVPGPYLLRHAPLLFEIANACENPTAAPDSWAARRGIRLQTFTKSYFTTLYRATKTYLAELTRLNADIVDDGGEPLVLEASFPDFVTTYVLPEDPPAP